MLLKKPHDFQLSGYKTFEDGIMTALDVLSEANKEKQGEDCVVRKFNGKF